MGFTNKNTAETQDFGVAVDRTAHLDDITVNFVSIRQTHSLKDALAGLPDGNCKCPHWGYVLSGSLTVDYGDRVESYGPDRRSRQRVRPVQPERPASDDDEGDPSQHVPSLTLDAPAARPAGAGLAADTFVHLREAGSPVSRSGRAGRSGCSP